MRIFDWLKRIFGFGPKKEVKVIKLKQNPILVPSESYKVEHKTPNYVKGGESMMYDASHIITVSKSKDDCEKALDEFKVTLNRRYPKPSEPDVDTSFIESVALGYVTDSTIEGTILGGDPLGAMIGEMLNNSDGHPNTEFDTSSDYNSGSSSYDSDSNYDSGSSSYDNDYDRSDNSDY